MAKQNGARVMMATEMVARRLTVDPFGSRKTLCVCVTHLMTSRLDPHESLSGGCFRQSWRTRLSR